LRGEFLKGKTMKKVQFWQNGYFEVTQGNHFYGRVWPACGSRYYTVQYGHTVTCAMFMDDFGNLRPAR
jgi:hypothetical protein